MAPSIARPLGLVEDDTVVLVANVRRGAGTGSLTATDISISGRFVAINLRAGKHRGIGPRRRLWPFNHHDKQDSALVPATDPANAPIIDTFAQGDGPEEPQELGLDFHNDPSMALSGGRVKAMKDAEEPN